MLDTHPAAGYNKNTGRRDDCGKIYAEKCIRYQFFENSHIEKPIIVTEFGADAIPHHRGTITDKGTEDCQIYVYEKQIETIRPIDYIRGMTPWILYDFRCPRRTALIQDYYNRKGLLSPDKKYRKPAFYVLQRYYQELKQKWEG